MIKSVATRFASAALLLTLIGLVFASTGYADEVIHFDCEKSAKSAVPQTDLLNNPPNNLQCLKTGASVLGNGTVYPQLEIRSPQGHRVVKIRSADPNPTVFISTDGATNNNNCLDYLDQGRHYVDDEFSGAWGFGDATACHSDSCSPDNSEKPALDFIFHDMTVNQFSIRMFDWGDYRPGADDLEQFQTTLTAYDANNQVVGRYNYLFSIDRRIPTKEIAYTCVSELDNSCYKGGSDLEREGNACSAGPKEPGYLTLTVDAKGISRLELRFPSHGYDPNIGFDTIRFTPE